MSLRYVNYRGSVPEEIAGKAQELYPSFYCTKDYQLLFRGLGEREINALVLLDEEDPVHVLFYRSVKGEITVLNEFFSLEDRYLEGFVGWLFENLPSVRSIHFNRALIQPSACSFPLKVWSTFHDIVINLPGSPEEYDSRLGKKTRKTIRYYTNKMKKEFESCSFSLQIREEIDPAVISRIADLNRERMKTLKITSVIDGDFERSSIELARKYGLVGYLELDGRMAAGVVCYETGSHSYGDLIAYDQHFNDYRVGLICAHSVIQALIERGSKMFHMGIGESDYKYRLGGERLPVYRFSVFRSEVCRAIGLLKHLDRHHYIRKAKSAFKYKIAQKIRHTFSGR